MFTVNTIGGQETARNCAKVNAYNVYTKWMLTMCKWEIFYWMNCNQSSNISNTPNVDAKETVNTKSLSAQSRIEANEGQRKTI